MTNLSGSPRAVAGAILQRDPREGAPANRHLALVFQVERDEASLPRASFVTQLFSGRLSYNFSPNVSWSNLAQYDSDSRLLGFQSRFRWTVRPGNDLFVVVGRGRFRRDDGDYVPSFDKGSAKLQYTFRI